MRIAIFGTGVIGGFMAAKLAEVGVVAIARGAQLAAIRANGITVIEGGVARTWRVAVTDDARALGPQDLVIVTLKAHSLPGAVSEIASLCGPSTVLIAAQNGLPWWYFYREGGALEGERIATVDPAGALYAKLDPARILGCVVQIAATAPEPGIVQHQFGNRFILGEPDGTLSRRLRGAAEVLASTGLEVPTTATIRREIWQKLWGNIAFNPLSVVTGGTMDRLIGDPGTRRIAAGIMDEAERVANRLGIRFDATRDARIDGLVQLGAYKTSMLQDAEAGRPVELGALCEAVMEIAARFEIPTPTLEVVARLARLCADRARPPVHAENHGSSPASSGASMPS
ncbi:MAG TPA: 2-dehydropantoate 2-reductase [Stellaceae bacterium]|nr:2-dehydropantoate 2-reductase [Stellaceae bacterium]